MPTSRIVRLTLLVAALAACRDSRNQGPRLQDALPFLPLPPNPEFVSRSGSEDALQVVMNTPLAVDTAIAMYRKVLTEKPWSLTSDQPGADGGRMFLATREGHPPLWVMIGPNPSGPGSRISLNGAVVPKPGDEPSRTPTLPPDTSKKAMAPAKPGH